MCSKFLIVKLLFIILIILYSKDINAQDIYIKGTVSDSTNQPLYGATISLIDKNNFVITYVFSGKDGGFKLPYFDNGVLINVSYIGYMSANLSIAITKKEYNIKLIPITKILNEIVVKTRPINNINGDTLSFSVNHFSDKEDQTIADVLKRIPGIEVANNGTISFNGKKIENLYIEGDDIMDGRYSIATKVIKKELIKSIEIISHHQPINVLRNKVSTDHTAVNLVLQNENNTKLSVSSTIGIGNTSLKEGSLAPILLNKNIKMISLVGYNNAGIDFKNEIKQLGGSNFLENISINPKNINLTLNSATPPDIPLNYYYFNNSSFFSINTIYKTKKSIQFKLNTNIYSDRNFLNHQSSELNYNQADTVIYSDKQTVINKPYIFNITGNLMINKTKYFLNNSFKVSIDKDIFSGQNLFNRNSFFQNLYRYDKVISNDFNWMPATKNKGITEVRLYSYYSSNNQHLDFTNNYYFDINPQKGFYENVIQKISSPTWYSNAYISYKIPSNIFLQEYRIGYKYIEQELYSKLSLFNNGITIPYSNDLGNNAKFFNRNIYLLLHYQIKRKRNYLDLQFPFLKQVVQSKQPIYRIDNKKELIIFLPKINFTYHFENEKYLQATYQVENNFGDITTSYNGSILLNFRNIQSYSQSFQNNKIHKTNIMYSFQKSIKLFYSNIGFSYDYNIANTIITDSLFNNISKTIFLPYQNKQTTFSLYAGISQYLFKIKSKFALKVIKQRILRDQFINNDLLLFQIDNNNLNITGDKKIAKIINLNYSANFSWLTMSIINSTNLDLPKTGSFSFDQNIKLSFNIYKSFYIETIVNHRLNDWDVFNKNRFVFFDLNIKRLNFVKRTDISLNFNNLMNVKNYTLNSQTQNKLYTSTFPTRGLTVFLRISHSF
jgi:hypothetical protein